MSLAALLDVAVAGDIGEFWFGFGAVNPSFTFVPGSTLSDKKVKNDGFGFFGG